jgi:Holliday junction resolvase
MTQYSRGADFERKVKADLQANGWFVVRSAGSRSIVDLLAIMPGPLGLFVQCKRDGRLSIEERMALFDIALAFNSIAVLAFKDDDGSIQYSEIVGERYEDWDPSCEDVARGAA